METAHAEGGGSSPRQADGDTHSNSRTGPFRFKRRSSSREAKDQNHTHTSHRHKRHRSSHESRHSSRSTKRRHKRSHKPPEKDTPPPNDHESPRLSPETAFRESLFDALGDDEGAAYWEGVYGQPIHTYNIPSVPKGPEGELEQMSDEEYATYVRAKMWERTREGMLEAQEQLRAERRRAKMAEERAGKTREREEERRAFERAMEESLARGKERKKRKVWEGVWGEYLARWEEIAKSRGTTDGKGAGRPLRNMLFWPVESGKRRDVNPDAVREFMRHAPTSTDLSSTLKVERVRWHPDKIQHRYGGLGIDDVVMRSVTEVFQVIDRMWNEERERFGKT